MTRAFNIHGRPETRENHPQPIDNVRVTIFLTLTMDILKMIAELQSERAAIEDALIVLERLARTRGKRRGRPPAWMSMVRRAAAESGEPKSRVFSADTRRRMAEAQKKRWATYRKGQQTASSK